MWARISQGAWGLELDPAGSPRAQLSAIASVFVYERFVAMARVGQGSILGWTLAPEARPLIRLALII